MKTLVKNTVKLLALFVMFSGAASVAQAGGKHGGGGSHPSHSSSHHAQAPAHSSAPVKHGQQQVKSTNPVKPVSGSTKPTSNTLAFTPLPNAPFNNTPKVFLPKTTTPGPITPTKPGPIVGLPTPAKTGQTPAPPAPKQTTPAQTTPKQTTPATTTPKQTTPKTTPTGKKGQQSSANTGANGAASAFGLGGLGSGLGGFGGGGIGGGGGFDGGAAGGFSDNAPLASDFSGSADSTIATSATPDLQVVGVQAVDGGSAADRTGPRYRVTVRNAGSANVNNEFMVSLSASSQQNPSSPMFSGSRMVNGLGAGETTQVDIRMPYSGSRMPASMYLTATADSQQEVNDSNRDNNSATVAQEASPTRMASAQ